MPEPNPKTFKCRHCHREIKIKKPRFALQQQGGHEANCSENPKVKEAKASMKAQVLDHQAAAAPLPSLQAGSITSQIQAGAPNLGALTPFMAPPQVPMVPGAPPMMMPGQIPVPEGDFIPPEVCAEFVLMIVSANFDIAVSYAKRQMLKDKPVKIEMSSETSRWLGKMISKELGPQTSSWGMIIGGLAPFIIIPWISIAAQGGLGKIGEVLRGLKDKMGLGNAIKPNASDAEPALAEA